MNQPTTLTRVTQIAMLVNAVLHSIGSIGMAAGLAPHTADQASMARRAAAAGFAAAVMFVFVSKRLRRDPALIALPFAFVLCNFAATIYDYLLSREPNALAPLVPEATFFVIYLAFGVSYLRSRAAARSV